MGAAADRPRVLLGISGGIAAYKTPELVRRLRDAGCEVRCALTPHASAFVAPLALEIVAGAPVYGEEYLEAGGDGDEAHIAAAAWADLILVAPATSHTLAALALGLADNFLLTTALAFRGPLLVAPAMHAAMWEQPATQARLAELLARGVELIGPTVGALASGEVAIGRMAEISDLVAAVVARLRPGRLAGTRVLITAGPTFEPIDPVRYLGNRSSGKMGFALAAAAARQGAAVDLVAGPVALPTPAGVARHDVESAREMEAVVGRLAPAADIVVMAAAIADFRPVATAAEKLKKRDGVPDLKLVANPDLLSQLADLAPDALRVGFAAETSAVVAEAERKLASKGAHVLVANDVSLPGIGFASDDNEVTVIRRDAAPLALPRAAKTRLAEQLMELFAGELERLRGARVAAR